MSEGSFLQVNGAKLNFHDYGSGKAIIFVHAGIADSRMWDDQVSDISKEFRMMTYDMRGSGLSSLVSGDYSHHLDLIALIDELNINECLLVGCSKGGGIAMDAALAAPDKVAGLVSVSSFAHGLKLEEEPEDFPEWEDMQKAFKAHDVEKTNELEIQMWVDGFKQSAGRADSRVREKVLIMNKIVLQNEMDAPESKHIILQPKAIGRLSELRMPILFINGALDDPYTIQGVELMLHKISSAKQIIIPDVAHLPNMEAPEEFNKTIANFAKVVFSE